jgi:hypothetical protein
MCRGVSVDGEAIRVALGGVRDALQEMLDHLRFAFRELVHKRVDLGHERRPRIGRPCLDLWGKAQHRAARIAAVALAGDVPSSLQAVNQLGGATGGQLQQRAEPARGQLAGTRQVLHGEDVVVGEAESPGERRALLLVVEAVA